MALSVNREVQSEGLNRPLLSGRFMGVFITACFIQLLVLGVLWFFNDKSMGLIATDCYDKIRGNLITGFLTMASFLFSMKTSIIFRLKSDVYDSDFYIKRKIIEINAKKKKEDAVKVISGEFLYKNLAALCDYLLGCILFSIIGTLINVVLGPIKNDLVRCACLIFSMSVVACLLAAWYYMHKNMDVYWQYLSKKKFNDTDLSKTKQD